MTLNIDFIARRQRELGLTRRDLSRALNTTLTRVTNLYEGTYHGMLTVEQLGRLANVLACPPERLLVHNGQPHAPAPDQSLVATVAALITSADGAVTPASLAKATGEELGVVEALLGDLDGRLEPLGLSVRRNANDGAVSIVAAAEVSDEQLKAVLRGAQARLEVPTNAAALLYRIMTSPTTPRSIEATNDKRVQYGRLVNGGLVTEWTKRTVPALLSDDVRESLLLDVR